MNRASGSPNYNAVDLAKLILALIILSAHFAATNGTFPALIDTGLSIYVIAVPFFFACSGFLLFGKVRRLAAAEGRAAVRKYATRLALLYLAWSGIYFAFVLLGWIQERASAAMILAYFHKALVFSTYATIWYLPALLVSVLAVYFLSRRFSFRAILVLGVGLYWAGSLGHTYSFLLPAIPTLESVYRLYDQIFITTRNGLFNGLPFVALGAWMATREQRIPAARSGLWAVFFLALLVLEAFGLKLGFKVRGVDTALCLMPFTFFFLEFLLAVRLPDRKIYRKMRDLSTLIFLGQRIYITALPAVLPVAWSTAAFRNPYLGLALVLGFTVFQSWILLRLSGKYAFLKVLR